MRTRVVIKTKVIGDGKGPGNLSEIEIQESSMNKFQYALLHLHVSVHKRVGYLYGAYDSNYGNSY